MAVRTLIDNIEGTYFYPAKHSAEHYINGEQGIYLIEEQRLYTAVSWNSTRL